MRLELSSQTYGEEEIKEVMASLASGYVTMGEKVKMFEKAFAEYIGVDHAVMVNSGSSANLVMLKAALERTGNGDAFLPALSWSTTYWPVVQAGYNPVFIDCDPKTLNMCPDSLRNALKKSGNPKVTVMAHIMGNPCEISEIRKLSKYYGSETLEDSCETLGSTFRGHKTGRHSVGASFSFYFSHHISTIEGGMFTTPSSTMADHARMLRSHGWVRAIKNEKVKKAHIKANKNIDPRFLFIEEGYNLRPTELQGAMGIHQLQKLDGLNMRRAEVYGAMRKILEPYSDHLDFITPNPDSDVYWFAFPVLVDEAVRYEFMLHMELNGIQTRPIVAGNLMHHPAMNKKVRYGHIGETLGADEVAKRGLYWGVHPGVTDEQIDYLGEVVNKYFEKRAVA